MPLIPHRFLFRFSLVCPRVADIPREGEVLLDLPQECRLENFADMDGKTNFADLRLGWNENGLGVQLEVSGKQQEPIGDATRPRQSDGLSLWIDTRDVRNAHRASRYCHQFHFLPSGGGPERDQPVFLNAPIQRAQQDAPRVPEEAVAFRCQRLPGGYRLEAFLPGAVLNGFDPEQNPRLGIYYVIRDAELGEQAASVGSDFPAEDPSLWSVLELAGS